MNNIAEGCVSPLSSRGITRGQLPVGTDLDRLALVVGHRVGIATVGAQMRGRVVLVVVERERHSTELGRLFAALYRGREPPAVVAATARGQAWDHVCRYRAVGVVCEKPPGRTHPVWSKASEVKWIIGLGGTRGAIAGGWKSRRAQLRHSRAGGVSDGVGRCTTWIRDMGLCTERLLAVMPPALDGTRDVYSVCDDLVGGPAARAPDGSATSEPVCEWAQERGHTVCEGRGLMPLEGLQGTKVRLPSVMTATKWTIRGLTTGERLGVLDVPKIWIDRASTSLKHDLEEHPVLALGVLGAARTAWAAPREQSEQVVPRVTKEQDLETPTVAAVAVGHKRPQPELEERTKYDIATKSDDAGVDVWLWDEMVVTRYARRGVEMDRCVQALSCLRRCLLSRWKVVVRRSFWDWARMEQRTSAERIGRAVVEWGGVQQSTRKRRRGRNCQGFRWKEGGHERYISWASTTRKLLGVKWYSGVDAITRAARAGWWEWHDGSGLFFWRWPRWYIQQAAEGVKVWLVKPLPTCQTPQRREPDPITRKRMADKINKVRQRRYIGPGPVTSLTSYFSVPKGPEDVRMVYDGTASGLNDAIWVPRFPLPTPMAHLRALEVGWYMADADIGEMFLNFPMDPVLRSACGVDLTPINRELGEPHQSRWHERWQRCAMGLKSSPYCTTQAMGVVEEVIRGNRHDPTNPFRWSRVRLNLPGLEGYDPGMAWVSKLTEEGAVAADLFVYVDDLRVTAETEDSCRRAMRHTCSILGHLGVQDAARKRRPPSREPGAWAGAVFRTGGSVCVTVTQEKWNKAKTWVQEMEEWEPDKIPLKRLMSARGFLLYVSRAFPDMVPYLKGLHATIDSWRPGRDDEGWKVEWSGDALDDGARTVAPSWVKAVPRWKDDVRALGELLEGDQPAVRQARRNNSNKVLYAFGDASQAGFGTTVEVDDNIHYMFGEWNQEMMKASSNTRELTNLVKQVEELTSTDELRGGEVFLFTDNIVAESVYVKGNSTSKRLFEGMLALRKMSMKKDVRVHVIHVPGSRMIAQGTDGLSRGDHSQGVMRGTPMLSFVPLGRSALERSPALRGWVETWWPSKAVGRLEWHCDPADWFDRCHRRGNHVWLPPPAGADVVCEELGRAIHKRPHTWHLVFVPRLFTARWARGLGREATMRVEIPPGGAECWSAEQHEPLFMYVCAPVLSTAPGTVRRTKYVDNFRSLLRHLWGPSEWKARDCLRQFVIRTGELAGMPEGMVCGVLQSPGWKPLPDSEGSRRQRGR